MKNLSQKTTKNTIKLIILTSDFHFHCCSCLKRAKINPSADPADSPGSSGSCPRTAARHLPSTCAGGQDDGSSQNKLPQIKEEVHLKIIVRLVCTCNIQSMQLTQYNALEYMSGVIRVVWQMVIRVVRQMRK